MSQTSDTGRVLLVDDEPAFQRLGAALLRGIGHQVTLAGDAQAAIDAFAEGRHEVVLLDLAMPPRMDPEAGLELIARFAAVPVIVMTGHGDHDLALRATALGAWDFLVKPIDPDMLTFAVGRALRKARLDAELQQLRSKEVADDLGLIGNTALMQQLRSMVTRVAHTNVSVMILGATGTAPASRQVARSW
jgi:two-component system NtrC family response regulator